MTTPIKRISALAAVAALGLAACGDDGNDADSATTAAPTEATASTEESSAASAEESSAASAEDVGTIVDVAVEAGSFTTLVAAVEAAGLVETLSGEGPYTVFAPTDEAFAAALDALGITADELLADTDTLTSILTYHVVPGEVPASQVVTLDGQSVATVNGAAAPSLASMALVNAQSSCRAAAPAISRTSSTDTTFWPSTESSTPIVAAGW